MLVKRPAPDERGSALVSVVVMMLVLTLATMTLAAIVTNTATGLSGSRGRLQARAAADAGLAAALAAFQRTKGCPPPVSSSTAPAYSVTCTPGSGTVTLTSTGHADGTQATVQAVYGFTSAQSHVPTVGHLTFFSTAGTNPPNVVTSGTPEEATVTIVEGGFTCNSALAANLVVEGNFTATYGCAVAGSVRTKGSATLNGGSSIGKDLSAAGPATLNSATIGGSLVAGGNVTASGSTSIGKDVASGGRVSLGGSSRVVGSVACTGNVDLDGSARVTGSVVAGGSADLESRSWIEGDLTSRGPADVDGTVDGDIVSGGHVVTGDSSHVTGSVSAAGTDRTWVHGEVGGDVRAAGPVTTHYNSVVAGSVTAADSGRTEVYGTIRGDVAAGGPVTVDYSGRVTGDVTAAGTGTTLVQGRVGGRLRTAGTFTVDYDGVVSGPVSAAGTGRTYVYGRLGAGLHVAGTVFVHYSGSISGDLTSSGTGTDTIYGTIGGDVRAGGDVELPAGRIAGDLTLPPSRDLTPKDAKTRVVGNVTSKEAPAPPGAPEAPSPELTVPPVDVAPPEAPQLPLWQDYGYSGADWPGYTVQVLGKADPLCQARNWATFLGSLTSPTILDATACSGGLASHPTSTTAVTIRTDVVVVSTEIDLSFVTFQPAAGASPHLWFVVPSAARSVKPSPGVPSGSGEIDLYSTTLGVPAMLYTPGRIDHRASTFTGSMYAAGITLDFSWPGSITAVPVPFPLPLYDTSGSTAPGGVFSVTRISQRELP